MRRLNRENNRKFKIDFPRHRLYIHGIIAGAFAAIIFFASANFLQNNDDSRVSSKPDFPPDALLTPVEERNTSKIDRWIAESSIDINQRSDTDATPLVKAAEYGLTDICEKLIDGGADINAFDKKQRTALYWAVVNKNLQLTKLLLENEADTEIPNSFNQYPLHRAAESNSTLTKLLIESGANVNCRDDREWTPLEWAIVYEQREIMSLLEQHGGER